MIVKITRNFSAPLLVIYDTSEPPKTPESPAPFCCSTIASTVRIDEMIMIMFNAFLIPRDSIRKKAFRKLLRTYNAPSLSP